MIKMCTVIHKCVYERNYTTRSLNQMSQRECQKPGKIYGSCFQSIRRQTDTPASVSFWS